MTATATAKPLPAKDPAVSLSKVAPERAAAEKVRVGARRHHHRAGYADEAHDCTLAEVDAPDDDDEGLADRDASSGQTLESWLLMFRGVTRSGKKIAIARK